MEFNLKQAWKLKNGTLQFFVNVLGMFKHNFNDDYNFERAYPYVSDTLKSGCLAGYLEK